jgi:hypothetical protein
MATVVLKRPLFAPLLFTSVLFHITEIFVRRNGQWTNPG